MVRGVSGENEDRTGKLVPWVRDLASIGLRFRVHSESSFIPNCRLQDFL